MRLYCSTSYSCTPKQQGQALNEPQPQTSWKLDTAGLEQCSIQLVFCTSSAQVWGKEWTWLFLPESKIRNMNITWFCMTCCKTRSEMSTVSTCLLVGWDGWETSHRLTTSKGSCTMPGHCWDFLNSYQCLDRKKKEPVYLMDLHGSIKNIPNTSAYCGIISSFVACIPSCDGSRSLQMPTRQVPSDSKGPQAQHHCWDHPNSDAVKTVQPRWNLLLSVNSCSFVMRCWCAMSIPKWSKHLAPLFLAVNAELA